MADRQWSNHKYIRKEGNRYIYPEDLQKTPKQRKLIGSVTDTNGNRVPVRGRAATHTIANKSEHYDRESGERLSPEEYQQKKNRKAALNSQGSGLGSAKLRKQISSDRADQAKEVREIEKMEKSEKKQKALNSQGSTNTQQDAKKQGEFSKRMMRQEREHDARDQIWRGTSAQEAAKKQGDYSKKMMRKEKTRRSRTKGADFVNRRLNHK